MRVLTRGDMDGLTATVLLTYVHKIDEISFVHPKDVQDGLVTVTDQDIVVNLPYIPGCALWFDHHVSEVKKLDDIGDFKGRFAVAPSCARVVYDYFKLPEFEKHREMLEYTDRIDAAQLTTGEVENPTGWILLGYTLDPRTGLGPEFRKYFRWLAEYVKEVPLDKVLEHVEVKKRCVRVLKEQEEFKTLLKQTCRMDGNVVITDLRGRWDLPVGNRFLVFTLFPKANVEARIFKGKEDNVVLAVGHSIFNRTCNVDVGTLLAKYGGGGHRGAGTAQFDGMVAEDRIKKVIATLKENRG